MVVGEKSPVPSPVSSIHLMVEGTAYPDSLTARQHTTMRADSLLSQL